MCILPFLKLEIIKKSDVSKMCRPMMVLNCANERINKKIGKIPSTKNESLIPL